MHACVTACIMPPISVMSLAERPAIFRESDAARLLALLFIFQRRGAVVVYRASSISRYTEYTPAHYINFSSSPKLPFPSLKFAARRREYFTTEYSREASSRHRESLRTHFLI